MVPASRQQFRDYCLRKLGYPVIEINVTDEQIDDRIDEALKYYYDYHFDGSEKIYYKHQITANDYPTAVRNMTLVSGGSGYSNTDTLTFSIGNTTLTNIAASIETDANGVIVAVNQANCGSGFGVAPTVTINSVGGSGASITTNLGGYIPIPENIIGAVNIFTIGSTIYSSTDMFNVTYQIALNDLYTITGTTMLPYYMSRLQISLIEEILVGKQPIRYNRHMNRLYIDMDWQKITQGYFIIVEAYQIVDPDVYTDVWGDRWLQDYAATLIQENWGKNLTKFIGMQMPGGLQFNGQQILQDAQTKRAALEAEMINSYSLPVMDMIG